MNNFENVIGYDGLKLELSRTIDILNNKEKYEKLGVEAPRGVLLVGDPGVGKTTIATDFVNALPNRYKLTLRKTQDDGKFVDEINKVFNEAKEHQPSIILLDDMDKFANNDRDHSDAVEFVTVQSKIDEYRKEDIFVIATANSDDEIPDSLLRAGRLKEIGVPVPKGKDAEKIISHYIDKKKFVSEIDSLEIAKILTGSSCAEIETVINQAGIYAGFENRDFISRDDLIRSCLRVINGAPEILDYQDDKTTYYVAIHEAGHTVAAELLEPGSVNLVSIKKSDSNIGGFTNFYEADDYWTDIKFMENRVKSLLAGRAATEIVLGKLDTGCGSDLDRAFRIARRFIDDYCKLGFDKYMSRFCNGDALNDKVTSFVSGEIEKYYAEVRSLLMENRKFLDKVTDALVEKKVICSNDIKNIRESL